MSDYEDYEEELVGSTTEKRNWKGIAIALLVIATVFGLIITAIVLIAPHDVDEDLGEKISYEDFIRHKFDPRPFHPIWRSVDQVIYRDAEGTVLIYNCTDNTTTMIMDNSTFRELDTEKYKISADGKYVLLPYNVNYIYRNSFVAKYRLYGIAKRLHVDLIGPIVDGRVVESEFQYVTWSPVGHSLIVVYDNDIYYLNSWASMKDIDNSPYVQLTFDGTTDTIYNGIPDWLYEEEVLLTDNAIWWSPDGSGIVYARFDDTYVQKYDMTIYGPLKNKYVENRRLPYPRPGTPLPQVTIHYVDLTTNQTVVLPPPKEFQGQFYYFTSVAWKDKDHVLITWLNRSHNVSILSICDIKTAECFDNFEVEAESGWLEMSQMPLFSPSGLEYFIILSQKYGDYGSFKHIAKVDASSNDKGFRLFVTSGKLEVKKILAYDAENHTIYFLAVPADDPRGRHLFSASTLPDAEDFRQPLCLTCGYSDDCLFVDATFSPDARYYVLSCNGPAVPYHQLMLAPFKKMMMLDDNAPIRQLVSKTALPKREFFEIETDDHQGDMWALLFLPPILKKSEILKYNLIMKVYGSPGTQMVTHEFSVDWVHYLSSTHDFIIGYVDARGSGGRGDDWMHSIYRKLGTLEVQDTLTAARHFKSLHYVEDISAIFGISHGGFVSASVLGSRDNVLNCGISVAPVTDWRFYDAFYSEKYMSFPTAGDNIQGYIKSNISQNATNFRKSKFLLVHGTGDDNVHFQNSAQLIKALTEQDVYFKTQIYTDEQHWLSGGNTRNHLYNTMEDFLYKCFGKKPPAQDPIVIIEEEDED